MNKLNMNVLQFYACLSTRHYEKMCLWMTLKNLHVNVIKSLSMSTCHVVSIYSMYYLKIIVEIMKKMVYKYCLLYVHCIDCYISKSELTC